MGLEIRRFCTALAATAMAVALGASAFGSVAHAATCADPVVEFLGISGSNITLAQRADGSFAGSVIIHVFCTDAYGNPVGDVTDGQVSITTNVPNTTFDGKATPASIDLLTGSKIISVVSTDPGLAPGQFSARVGSQTATATVAFGSTVPDGYGPKVTTNIFARTPELSSIALLASGGVGAAAYLLVAARARRRRS
jgi:hypothetical protein